jgi:hypothetical protein
MLTPDVTSPPPPDGVPRDAHPEMSAAPLRKMSESRETNRIGDHLSDCSVAE